jgi:hypothetical protein
MVSSNGLFVLFLLVNIAVVNIIGDYWGVKLIIDEFEKFLFYNFTDCFKNPFSVCPKMYTKSMDCMRMKNYLKSMPVNSRFVFSLLKTVSRTAS